MVIIMFLVLDSIASYFARKSIKELEEVHNKFADQHRILNEYGLLPIKKDK
jgi:hypothetical protein